MSKDDCEGCIHNYYVSCGPCDDGSHYEPEKDCENCYYGWSSGLDCPEGECGEYKLNWKPKDEPKEPENIPDEFNWFKNFEIGERLKVLEDRMNIVESKPQPPDFYTVKECSNCMFRLNSLDTPPCYDCIIRRNWTPKDKKEEPKEPEIIKTCDNCLYGVINGLLGHFPCPEGCDNSGNWRPNTKEEIRNA